MGRSTPVYDKIVETPEAWTAQSLGSVEKLVRQLTPAELAAIDTLLAATRHKAPQKVTREEFDHPLLNKTLAELKQEIFQGKGVVLVRGLTRERYSEEDFERIYWGFGTHWGDAAVQSVNGDRIGHVRKEKVNLHNRGYMDDVELVPHTDAYALVGLLCVQRAEAGGLSHMVSIPAIHNEILRTRPELLAPLYRGFPTAIYEARGTEDAISDGDVPLLSCIDGKISALYSRRYVKEAADQLGIDYPPDFAEALDYFEMLAQRPDLRLEFQLQPGEMMVWNNFAMLHARTAFQDSEAHVRHLLRLWLNVPGSRPVIPEVFTWGLVYDKLNARRMAAAAAAE